MTTAAAKILADALALSVAERAEIASDLIASLDDGAQDDYAQVAKAWVVELERRVAELDAGSAEVMPLVEAMTGLRARLRVRREAGNQ